MGDTKTSSLAGGPTWRTVPTVTGTTAGQPILVSWPKGSAMVSVEDAHWAGGAESDAIRALLPNQQNAGLLVVSVKYQQVSGTVPATRMDWYAITSGAYYEAMPPVDEGALPDKVVHLEPGDTLEGHLYFDLHPGVADVHLREQVNFMAVWPSVACDPAEQETQPENQCGR